MKIGINALAISEGMTGIGNYTKDLVNALAEYGEQHSYCILSKKKIKKEKKENWEELLIERIDRLWEELHIPYELSARGVDIYHTPLFACPIMEAESIAAGLSLAYKDKEKRKNLRERGIKRAKDFTNRKFGERLMKFYGKMEESISR